MPRGTRPSLRDERGAALAIFLVWLPVIVVLAGFVIDVGNWYVHKRHLQTQVDAGALAGGGTYSFPSCDATAISNEAIRYAGKGTGTTYNAQVGGANKGTVTVLLNSKTFAKGGFTDPDTIPASPCTAPYMVDLKATEANLPSFFPVIDNVVTYFQLAKHEVPAINAHARVEVRKIKAFSGQLPFAVPDSTPRSAAAIVVNEASGATIASFALQSQGGRSLNGKTLQQWQNTAPAPVTIPSGATRVGIVVALSGAASLDISSNNLATICGRPLTACYPGAAANGLLFIHAYNASAVGTPAAPVVLSATLSGTCADASAPYFVFTSTCSGAVSAQIKWGATFTPPAGAQVKVSTGTAGCPNSGSNPKGCTMLFNALTNRWTTTTVAASGIPRWSPGSGPDTVSLVWGASGLGNNNQLPNVQRAYGANAASEPIEYAQVSEGLTTYANSLAQGAHSLQVTIGVAGALALSGPTDPPIALRLADPSGSRNQALDCDANRTFREEIAGGCVTPYQLNTGQACPNATIPANCVPVETGDKLGLFRQGIEDRFTQPCTPNNWPVVADGDKRLVTLIITPFGSFSGSGSGQVPVINLGAFYVTGWDSNATQCAGNDPFPGPGTDTRGDIWGHYVKYVDPDPGGDPSDETCDPNDVGVCAAVLTR